MTTNPYESPQACPDEISGTSASKPAVREVAFGTPHLSHSVWFILCVIAYGPPVIAWAIYRDLDQKKPGILDVVMLVSTLILWQASLAFCLARVLPYYLAKAFPVAT